MTQPDHLSPERVGRITASRLPGILGLSPFTDRAGTMREMVRQQLGAEKEFTGNVMTDWGHEHEPDAITAYERHSGVLVMPSHCYVLDRLAATPDGEVGIDGLIEAKAPYTKFHPIMYSRIEERPDYEAQIRLQLHVTGKDWADFPVWYPDGLATPVSRVKRDPDWYPSIADQLAEFLAEYDAIVSDPDAAQPFLEPLVDERTDPDWQLATIQWKEARLLKNRYEALMNDARDELIVLAGRKKSRGFGVQVIPSHRKGAVKKSMMAALTEGIDLDLYRGKGTDIFTVRLAGESDES